LKVFTRVARHASMTVAADELHLSQSAVSQHIRSLESALGVELFRRVGRKLVLTPIGSAYAERCSAILSDLTKATDEAMTASSQRNTVSVRVRLTLGVRWLIPMLPRFHEAFPGILIRVETLSGAEIYPSQEADVSIIYRRAGDEGDSEELLMEDIVQPVSCPNLLAVPRDWPRMGSSVVPIISGAFGNWDWRLWAKSNQVDFSGLNFAHYFDTDDAVLRAATAGLGVALTSRSMIAAELQSGLLDLVPGQNPVNVGSYVMIVGTRNAEPAQLFVDWLREAAERARNAKCHRSGSSLEDSEQPENTA
jgi:LysR family glycine cleavage system transcriptional activator